MMPHPLPRGSPVLVSLMLLLTFLASLPVVSAYQTVTGGTADAKAIDEPFGGRGASASANGLNVVVPPDSLLGTSTTVRVVVDPTGQAWISDECNAVQYLCEAFVQTSLHALGQTPVVIYAACASGSGCDAHPSGIGHNARMPGLLEAEIVVSHGLLGMNSETETFNVCAEARVYLDLDGDGSWSDDAPWRQSQDCDQGTVRVSGL